MIAKALVYSVTEVPVISQKLLEGTRVEEIGKIHLQRVAGDAIPAKFVKIEMRMGSDGEGEVTSKNVLAFPGMCTKEVKKDSSHIQRL